MQKQTESPERRMKQFVETISELAEFDQLTVQDFHPADRDTFVTVAWNPTQEGREQITKLQYKVEGVDKRFEGVNLDIVNVGRAYAKFEAELPH